MSGGLQMPTSTKSAASMLQDLNAEHAGAVATENDLSQAPAVADVPVKMSRRTKPSRPVLADGDRLDAGLQIAAEDEDEEDITVVTIRVSKRLNKHLERVVTHLNEGSKRGRYRKQDAIAEAFARFYAAHPLPDEPKS